MMLHTSRVVARRALVTPLGTQAAKAFAGASDGGARRWGSAYARMQENLAKDLAGMHEAGTYKAERFITSPQSAEISVQGSEHSVLNFCANNYLGLSNNPEVAAAAKAAIDSRGYGLSSVRFICGTQDIHKQLEAKISEFHEREDTILYPSCFDANAGLFEALLGPEDAIISDALNHASIIDGVRLCKAKRFRYAHADMADLEKQLQASQDARYRLIATDGVFSMDGNIAPLGAICDLADKYDALVFVDECHATGFFGKTGRGTEEYLDCKGRVDIINSTLGKGLGGATGGYTTGPKEIVDMLKNKGRPYLFSNTLAPAVVGASLKVFDMLMEDSSLVETVLRNTHHFRDRMAAAGFELKGAKDHPICPVMLYDAKLATEFADEMLKRGVYVIGFSYPVVPQGQARIRVQLSAAHSIEQVDAAVDSFIEVGRSLDVIS